MLEKTLESPLDCKEIQPVPPRGNQSWIFIGRTDAEAETPILWPPHAKSWLIEKDPDAGRVGGRRRRGQQRMKWLDGITDLIDMSLDNSRSWWWTGRPGVLWFMGSQRVGYDWVTELSWYTHMPANAGDTGSILRQEGRKWQLSLVVLPEKSHGQRSLTGYSPWGHKESDIT